MTQQKNAIKAWFGQLVDEDERFGSKQWFKAYAYILFGTLLFVIADVVFAMPYHLAPGGVYGLANVLTALTGVKLTIYLMSMEIPLLIIGSIILGPRFGVKTIVSIVLGWLFTFLIETYWGYEPLIHCGEFIKDTLAAPMGALAITNSTNLFVPDYFLNTILAGLLYGIGIGMIFKSGATSGGSDIISMIVNKYTGLSLGTLVIIVDSTIALSSLLIEPDLRFPAYSILLIFIEGKIIDMVIDGLKTNKTILVISHHSDEIFEMLRKNTNSEDAVLKTKGTYKGTECDFVYAVLPRGEYVKMKTAIRNIDSAAFVNVIDSSEVYGKGFKELPKH